MPAALERIRSSVPPFAIEPLVRMRLRRAWKDPDFRRRAHEQVALLLDGTEREHEAAGLAFASAANEIRVGELRWHPNLMIRQRVENAELLERRKPGQGLVISFMHHGWYDGLFGSLRPHTGPMHIAAAPHMVAPDARPNNKACIRVVRRGGTTVPATSGAAETFIEVLRSGGTVAIAADFRGTTTATFLGKRFLVSTGSARIAQATGSLVVASTTRLGEDGRPFLRLEGPLDPGDFDGPAALLQATLRLHEAPILAWPEGVDRPFNLWRPAQ